ncbi:UDP-N-acetylmuramate--L-alanine ligase [Bacteroidota bacterium]
MIYFLGIGGIGMSALARWFKMNHLDVSGYDKTQSTLTDALISEGIPVNFTDDEASIPEQVKENSQNCLVVRTPAVPYKNNQLRYFFDHGYEITKRSEVLGEVTRELYTIATAGTHGKTSTSSLISHLFMEAGLSFVSFLGGIPANYQTNLVVNGNVDDIRLSVVEADEYDRSFHRLSPDHAIITSADPDHLDIYGDFLSMKAAFREFINLLPTNGDLLIKNELTDELIPSDRPDIKISRYGLDSGDITASNLSLTDRDSIFDYSAPGIRLEKLKLRFPGYHNVENAIAAIHSALSQGITEDQLRKGMDSYKGIKRRFEYHIDKADLIYIDDYAHHPEEIKALLHSVRDMYPDKSITAIFQPHLFTRTQDFSHEFAESLDLADQVILLDIYPAREDPIEGVNSELIYNALNCKERLLLDKGQLLESMGQINNDIVVTIGAGDIDRLVEPLKEMLEEK